MATAMGRSLVSQSEEPWVDASVPIRDGMCAVLGIETLRRDRLTLAAVGDRSGVSRGGWIWST
ncbi:MULTISPECIES: hypothetical protein [Sorangium]|uniref:hypothetical protein n=1 Tax=Sorangium TaxID=39643 RepID=UPI003D9C0B09